jgi:hypothetical protein
MTSLVSLVFRNHQIRGYIFSVCLSANDRLPDISLLINQGYDLAESKQGVVVGGVFSVEIQKGSDKF